MGNTADKSMCEMKAGDRMALMTCKYKVLKPNHGNLQLVDTSLKSKRREETFSALLTFLQQSANYSSIKLNNSQSNYSTKKCFGIQRMEVATDNGQ